MVRAHHLVIVNRDESALSGLEAKVKSAGHIPHPFPTSAEAITWLQETDSRGIANYKLTAAILCGYLFSDNEGRVSTARKTVYGKAALDPQIPVVLTTDAVTADMCGLGKLVDRAFAIDSSPEQWKTFLDNLLFERVIVNKPILVVKYGGSTTDFERATGGVDLKVREILQYLVNLQKSDKYQVVITSGAGITGELDKIDYQLYRGAIAEVRKTYALKMAKAIETNLTRLQTLMGEGERSGKKVSTYIDPRELMHLGPAYIQGALKKNRILLMGLAPRHQCLDLSGIVGNDDPWFPNLPPYISDGHTLRIMNMLWESETSGGAEDLILVKRTTHLCKKTPLLGFNREYPPATKIADWRQMQRENEALYGQNPEQVLALDREEDGLGDHFFEDAALRLMRDSGMTIRVYVVHPNPLEMMPEGRHIIPGVESWYKTPTETFDAILAGHVRPSILQRAS
ncbi:MAG: hypothetical protein Q7S65_00655 [Nanoarchaeota archaeon]|nr:hypothetical protein [Nanoarchaeota archaeon]